MILIEIRQWKIVGFVKKIWASHCIIIFHSGLSFDNAIQSRNCDNNFLRNLRFFLKVSPLTFSKIKVSGNHRRMRRTTWIGVAKVLGTRGRQLQTHGFNTPLNSDWSKFKPNKFDGIYLQLGISCCNSGSFVIAPLSTANWGVGLTRKPRSKYVNQPVDTLVEHSGTVWPPNSMELIVESESTF